MVELREFHCTSRLVQGMNITVKEGEVVTVCDENQPRELWRLGRIVSTIEGPDGNIRGARVRVLSKKGRTTIIQQPIQHLYPLEVGTTNEEPNNSNDCTPDSTQQEIPQEPTADNDTRRARHSAAVEARDKIIGCFTD